MHKRRYKGFDYEARNPKPPPDDQEDKWVHKGGGWYENTVTGEKRQGRPIVP